MSIDVIAPAPALPSGVAREWRYRCWGTVALLSCLWLILINRLRLDWETNPQYSYGWVVPGLAAYLFHLRWPSRPEPRAPGHAWWLAMGAAFLAFCFWPTRLVHEATPEWSAVSWTLATEVVGLTLAAVAYAAGWPSARHFAWPICFIFVAVAWPVRFETALTQALMQRLAGIAVELLSWAGLGAEAHGNLIKLESGLVGVDEACSGVRSLQSMLMASLFLGELNRLKLGSRLGLVATGLGIAVFFNVVRALWLVVVAVRSGIPALKNWHDPAGISILIVSFGVLFLMVRLFVKSAAAPTPQEPRSRWRPLPKGLLVWLAGWLCVTEASTEAWYRVHESRVAAPLGWSVHWPEKLPSFTERQISPQVSKMLAYNEGREGTWQNTDGSNWKMFAFKWYPGRTSTISARLHRPEVCLPGGGEKLVQEYPVTIIQAGQGQVPFRTYQFDARGQSLFVFFVLWEMGSRDLASNGLPQEYTRSSRLARVRIGQRNLGQQSMEVIISGYDDAAAATAAFRAAANFLVVPEAAR